MENATLLTYLAATVMDHQQSTSSSIPLSTPRPRQLLRQTPRSTPFTAKTPRLFHPMHSTGYNRQGAKRSGDVMSGGPHRVSLPRGTANSGTRGSDNGLDRPITGAIVIGSIFLFITMSITAAILVFCKKKNTVFIFGAGNKNEDMYGDTSVNLNPEDLLDDNSDDDDDFEDDDESPSSERRRDNEAVALDPRLLRDPRGLELIALTSGRHDLNLLYRNLLRYQRASNMPPAAHVSVNDSDNCANDLERGDRKLPAYRVSAATKYQRMQCSAVVENHSEESSNSQFMKTAPDGAWLSLDNLERRTQVDPQRLGAVAIAASVREDVIRNPRVKMNGPASPHDVCVDMTDPAFFVNPHFMHADPPVEETKLGSSPSHRPWRQKTESPTMDFSKDLTSLHVTLVSNSGQRMVCFKPGQSSHGESSEEEAKQEEEDEEEEEETESNALLEPQGVEEGESEAADNLIDDNERVQALLEDSSNNGKTEPNNENGERQTEANEPLLTE